MREQWRSLLVMCFLFEVCKGFLRSSRPQLRYHCKLCMAKEDMSIEDLKSKLIEYLEVRKENDADEKAKENVGKVIGGSKGNAMLEFMSLAPTKEMVIETPSNALDYDELSKYGYGYLATPIMNAGGRFEMYKLLGMSAPEMKRREKKETPEIVIDRSGATDKARYSGLKMGLLDDDAIGEALAQSQEKAKVGESLRPKLVEEDYVVPFADQPKSRKSNTDWTAEKLDAQIKRRSEWAQKERARVVIKDPYENLEMNQPEKVFSFSTTLLAATAFGRATPAFLSSVTGLIDDPSSLISALQVPAGAFLLGSVVSSVFCAVTAAGKNRSPPIWWFKGLTGGPFSVRQLVSLSDLKE